MNHCSVCSMPHPTVDRKSFSGMCIHCTQRALNDDEVLKRAEKNNQHLKQKGLGCYESYEI